AEFAETLQHTRKELSDRERLATIGELAATVAHELRNPLGVLFNSVSALRRLMREGAAPTMRVDVECLLSIVSEAAKRLNAIVSDLLECARPHTMRMKEASLESIVRSVTNVLPQLPEATRVNVQIELASNVPALRVDPRLMRQAVLNLVVNALQAMPTGGS